jgi:hypothetical protein
MDSLSWAFCTSLVASVSTVEMGLVDVAMIGLTGGGEAEAFFSRLFGFLLHKELRNTDVLDCQKW